MPNGLTTREVASRLRCSHERVFRLIRAGRLRALNAGTGTRRPRWIIDVVDLERFENGAANVPARAPWTLHTVAYSVGTNSITAFSASTKGDQLWI